MSATLEVFVWQDEDEISGCADCGDDVEVGQQYVYEPAPEYGHRMTVVAHHYCAVKNGFVLRP